MSTTVLRSLMIMAVGWLLAAAPGLHGQQVPLHVESHLYSDVVTLQGAPHLPSSVSLWRDNEQVVTGWGVADGSGTVQITFSAFASGVPVEELVVRPGDTLVLDAEVTDPLTLTVPALFGSLDPGSDVVGGIVPVGSTAGLEVFSGSTGQRLTAAEIPTSEPEFRLALAPDIDTAPGDYATISVRDARATFVAVVAAFHAEAQVGGRELRLVSSAGSQVSLELGQDEVGPTTVHREFISTGVQPIREFVSRSLSVLPIYAFEPGATIRIIREDYLLESESAVIDDVVASLDIDYLDQRVTVQGPPDTFIDVTLTPPLADTGDQIQVVTDDTGTAGVPVEVGPGTRIDLMTGFSIAFRRTVYAEQLRAHVDVPAFGVVGRPLELYRVELRRNDSVVAASSGTLSDRGTGSGVLLAVDGEHSVPPRPGDRVHFAIAGRTVATGTVPDLTVQLAKANNTVSGTGPPGSSLLAARRRADGRLDAVRGATSDNGSFELTFDEEHPLLPGQYGVAGVLNGPIFFVDDWVAPQLVIDLVDATIAGTAPAADPATVTLTTDGASQSGEIDSRLPARTSPESWLSELPPRPWRWNVSVSTLDASVPRLDEGDVVNVTVRGHLTTVQVPAFQVDGDAAKDSVTIAADPGLDAVVEVFRLNSLIHSVSAAVPSTGTLRVDTTEAVDTQHGDWVVTTLIVNNHHLVRSMGMPGFVTRLDSGLVSGVALPGSGVSARLVRDGSEVAWAHREPIALWYGEFEMLLRDGHGNVVLPRPGDSVLVDYDGRLGEPMSTAVPDLTARWIEASGHIVRVEGTCSCTGGLLRIKLSMQYDFENIVAYAFPFIAADGTFDAAVATNTGEPLVGKPGMTMKVYLAPAEEHAIERWLVLPKYALGLNSARVHGLVDPWTDTRAWIERDVDGTVAEGAASSGAYHQLNERIRMLENLALDLEPATVDLALGDQLIAETAGIRTTVDVAELTADVDWTNGLVTGSAPSAGHLTHVRTAGCALRPRTSVSTERVDRYDAKYESILRREAQPGETFTISQDLQSGHRVFRTLVRPVLRTWPARSTVDGCTTPRARVAVAVLDEDGATRIATTVRADHSGQFSTGRLRIDGIPIRIRATDYISFTTGAESGVVPLRSFELVVLEDAFELTAAPESSVLVKLTFREPKLDGGRWTQVITLDTPPDGRLLIDQGVWSADYTFADLLHLEAAQLLTSQSGVTGYAQIRAWSKGGDATAYLPLLQMPDALGR